MYLAKVYVNFRLQLYVVVHRHQFLAEHMDALQSDSCFEATISKFDSNFSTLLLDLLDKLSVYSTNDCEHSMINIIYRWVYYCTGLSLVLKRYWLRTLLLLPSTHTPDSTDQGPD